MMVEITFDLDTSPIGKLPSKWEKAKSQGLFYNAQDLTRLLIDETSGKSINVRHGLLHDWSITSRTDEQVTITSPAVYAAAQNYGTGPYDIFVSPKSKSALFWGEYDKGSGKPIMSKGHTIHHPGLKPRRFVEKSFERLQPFIMGNFLKAMEEQQ